MIVYKSKNTYESWIIGSPPGTTNNNSNLRWFDTKYWLGNENFPISGDNLASHFFT